jgi:hypothetical protein
MSSVDTAKAPKVAKKASKKRKAIAPKMASGQNLDVDDHKVTVGQSFSDSAKMTMRDVNDWAFWLRKINLFTHAESHE